MKTSKSHIAQMCISIDHQITRAKDAFEYFIKDKSLPLEVRWETFVETPSYLKNHSMWYYSFKCKEELNWYEDCGSERCSLVDLAEFITGLEENIEWAKEYAKTEGIDYVNEEWYDEELIIKMKEEILTDNMGSFRYDW